MSREPHRVNPRQPKGGNRDGVSYDLGYHAGRASGGGGKKGCPLTLLVLPLLVLRLLLSRPKDGSGPLGRRGDDPRHKDGSWAYERPADDEDPNPPPPPDDVDGYRLGRNAK